MPFSPRFSAADAQVLERDAVYEGFFSFEKLRLKHRLFGGWLESAVEPRDVQSG